MDNVCQELHKIFNSLKRFSFPFEEEDIPNNGIYILFEKGELSHGGDRIVRIGTHTGENQLSSRLKQHFINENKDRSILRNNIGRALLNKVDDEYLKLWELDLTTRKNKEKYLHFVDQKYQNKIEQKITGIIQSHFSFIVFKVNDKNERLHLESKIIS